jgi:hypothetical protein
MVLSSSQVIFCPCHYFSKNGKRRLFLSFAFSGIFYTYRHKNFEGVQPGEPIGAGDDRGSGRRLGC